MKYSLVLPTFNEAASGVLQANLSQFAGRTDVECLCVDGGSTDGTAALARYAGVPWIAAPGRTRAARLNIGMRAARGRWIVCVHPRSLLPPDALAGLDALVDPLAWGGWTHTFDHAHPLLRFTSWYSNRMRADRRSIFYLDHCLFLRRDLVNTLGTELFPDVPIFEDTEASLRLRALGRGVRLPQRVVTSSIRFTRAGVFRQSWRNQCAKLWYRAGLDLVQLNRLYEGRQPLNGVAPIGQAISPSARASAAVSTSRSIGSSSNGTPARVSS